MRAKLLAAATAVATVAPPSAASAEAQPTSAPQGADRMAVSRRADQRSVSGPAGNFTGRVTITGVFQRPAPSRVGGAIVRFEPGARTAWHSHPLGQTLIVTEGVGWTQIEGRRKVEFRAGDILWCPPGHRHWHGATPASAMAHIAIQETLNGSPVTWMEHVTDEHYFGAVGSKERDFAPAAESTDHQ